MTRNATRYISEPLLSIYMAETCKTVKKPRIVFVINTTRVFEMITGRRFVIIF
jgi:hypothetical protein